jgi:hypothetical protein
MLDFASIYVYYSKKEESMKTLILHPTIENKIFIIHGHKVMLSNHLAELYGVTTSALIQAVKRNIDRFPDDFMFTLNRQEIMNLSQFVISSRIKHAPNVYAFTEQGVAMLSSILRSKRAIYVNIEIMRAFVRLRKILSSHKKLAYKLDKIEKAVKKHEKDIGSIFEIIRQLMAPAEQPKRRIGFHTD